ncbi:hypothetical protein vBBak6_089 [Bacillus phage v_B-Bak6]|uniref:Uncharacterized protein n=2 Tax=Basiliskvirus TaxID=3044670 RepID=A0A385IK74_9CAUD|nr:hypothetical protein PP653_gp069 [Bacillus phage Basilisk]YP_010656992.1 hypothetical protein PP654_gp057 [Bacillus phage v_B-Bak10]AXY83049.1 hypothetical protein vBBak1_089 [Bacillus phage v_B-Bak1]AXY83169.1 hypothetical protein vBBak6_089 [Bacillus phage v_B-Bak6]AGR46640.1 hypothetical protein BASILISK_98 [Bacillus phage Basilisk]AXY83317.1 hypothetical protein vBBBak10_085 [Bacillus phage v_B-Bak10]
MNEMVEAVLISVGLTLMWIASIPF